MTLRRKTVLIIGSLYLVLLGVSYGISCMLLLRHFMEMEARQVRESVQWVQNTAAESQADGRFDAECVRRLSSITHLSLAVRRIDDPDLPADFLAAKAAISSHTPIVVRPLNADRVAGYRIMPDITGKPGLMIRVDIPRTFYRQGAASIRHLMLLLALSGLAFGLTIIVMLETTVLRRLARLIREIGQVGNQRDLSARVTQEGKDELAQLAGTVNHTLQALEESQKSLRKSEQRYHAVIAQVSDAIYLVDARTRRILEANAAFERLLGYSTPEIPNLTIYDIYADPQPTVDKYVDRLIRQSLSLPVERLYRRRDGTVVEVECGGSSITYDAHHILCISVRDITARKAAERSLLQVKEETEIVNRSLEAAMARANDLAEEAAAANLAKSEFLASMSHELRPPCTESSASPASDSEKAPPPDPRRSTSTSPTSTTAAIPSWRC